MRPSSSRRSARATTAGARSSPSARTRAGVASSSRAIDAGPDRHACSTSPPAPRAVALELVRQKDCYVVGVDLTAGMLDEARRRVALAAAAEAGAPAGRRRALDLPFEDGQFDALTFTYLLRYVDDPPATLRELARVVKPRRDDRRARVRRAERGLAAAVGALDARRPPGRGPADRRRLARGRLVPRPVDPRALRRAGRCAASSQAWRDGGHRAGRRRGGSASAAGW